MGGLQRIMACVGLAFAVSACSTDAGQIHTAKNIVREELLDGSSAQFEDVVSSTITDGRKLVCGWVNGKNRLGAYTGFEHFVVAEGAVQVLGNATRPGYETAFGACIARNAKASARQNRELDRAVADYEAAVEAALK